MKRKSLNLVSNKQALNRILAFPLWQVTYSVTDIFCLCFVMCLWLWNSNCEQLFSRKIKAKLEKKNCQNAISEMHLTQYGVMQNVPIFYTRAEYACLENRFGSTLKAKKDSYIKSIIQRSALIWGYFHCTIWQSRFEGRWGRAQQYEFPDRAGPNTQICRTGSAGLD